MSGRILGTGQGSWVSGHGRSALVRLSVGSRATAASKRLSVGVLESDPQCAVRRQAPNQTAAQLRAERQAECPWHGGYARSGHARFEGLHALKFDGTANHSPAPTARLTVQKAVEGLPRPAGARAASQVSSGWPHVALGWSIERNS